MTEVRPRVVLIGPPGSGKTTVASALAQRLGLPVHDTDAAVEAQAGTSIADLFVVHGEAHFRDLEAGAVDRALRTQAGVVALGGGAPMTPSVEAALAGHRVVFLDVGIADAAGRVGFDRSRPLLAVNPRASWVAMMKVRRPVYERVATWRVDTAGRTPEEIAEEIADRMAGAAS